jgi:hypothetical protein
MGAVEFVMACKGAGVQPILDLKIDMERVPHLDLALRFSDGRHGDGR